MILPRTTILRICEDVLGEALTITTGERGQDVAYCTCPGRDAHTKGNGQRDCRVIFTDEGTVRLKCFHSSCEAARETAVKEIYRRIAAARKAGGYTADPQPQRRKAAEIPRRAEHHKAWAADIAARCPISPGISWLKSISPVPIPDTPTDWPPLLLDNLFDEGDQILIFTRFASQGQYIYRPHDYLYKAAEHPGERDNDTPGISWPTHTPEGAWYLTAPITGEWLPKADGEGYTRRSAGNCTRFPYVIMESDSMAPAAWLRILVQMRYPIAAVYTSGGKSVHSVIRIAALPNAGGRVPSSPDEFRRIVYGDGTKANPGIKTYLVNLGADPAAIRPVQLSRLPGFVRGEKVEQRGERALQRLLYLAPGATHGTPMLCRACTHRDRRENGSCADCHCHKNFQQR